VDEARAACWLLFYQTPTDRALAGWAPAEEFCVPPPEVRAEMDEQDFVCWVAPELVGGSDFDGGDG
jgi:hypothetical protein